MSELENEGGHVCAATSQPPHRHRKNTNANACRAMGQWKGKVRGTKPKSQRESNQNGGMVNER